jgi:uncharacterized phage protein (TIGR01671 family)
MREIKFRAWYKGEPHPICSDELEEWEKPKMFYGVEHLYDGGVDGLGGVSSFGSLIDDPDYILMQYTGLKDKNGVEIYEGDVVSVDRHRGAIAWDDSRAAFTLGTVQFAPTYPIASKYLEVIGNIHENPELLND